MLFWILKIIFYIPLQIIFPVKVIGKKNMPKKGRVILAPNHQTLNDAIMVGLELRRRFVFMAKEPLFRTKFSNWFLRSIGAYPVHTSSSDVTAVKTTLRHLKKEKAVCIFPEGKRVKAGENADLKNGVAMFALRTKTPVVPAQFVKRTYAFKFNTMLIGKPIYLHQMEQFAGKKIDKQLLDQASAEIAKQMKALKQNYLKTKQKHKPKSKKK